MSFFRDVATLYVLGIIGRWRNLSFFIASPALSALIQGKRISLLSLTQLLENLLRAATNLTTGLFGIGP